VQVPRKKQQVSIDPGALGLSHLAQFVGAFVNRQVLGEMQRAGFGDLRESHGYLVQHLLRGPHSVGQLAKLLGVSQQAVSKTVAELTSAGYLEVVPGEDARVRLVQLSARGQASVQAARRFRERVEVRLKRRLGERRARQLHASLLELLDELGGLEQVAARRVPLPDAEGAK
jgi:DNA-binding MarR family transcriptional regulator